MAVLRPLGPVETAIWLLDRAGPLNFCVACEIVGPLIGGALTRALRLAQARHPLLRVAIEVSGDRARFAEPDPPPPIPLQELAVPARETPGLIEAEIQTPIPWAQAPLLRAVWLRHGLGCSTLLLTFHHAIGDGFSGAYLARDVLHACGAPVSSEEDPAALPLPAPLEDHLPMTSRDARGVLGTLGEFLRQAWMHLRLRGLPATVAPERKVPVPERRAGIVPLRLAPETTAALLARCRAEGTTLHGALGAALTLAVVAELGTGARGVVANFGSPVNLRARMTPPVGEDIGLFVSLAAAQVRVHADSELWPLARALRHETAAANERGAPFRVVPAMGLLTRVPGLFPTDERGVRRVAAFVDRALGDQMTTGLTNLGALRIAAQAGPLRFTALHFAVSPSAMGRILATAASLDGELRMNVIHSMPWVSRERAARVAAATLARLEQAR